MEHGWTWNSFEPCPLRDTTDFRGQLTTSFTDRDREPFFLTHPYRCGHPSQRRRQSLHRRDRISPSALCSLRTFHHGSPTRIERVPRLLRARLSAQLSEYVLTVCLFHCNTSWLVTPYNRENSCTSAGKGYVVNIETGPLYACNETRAK